MFVSFLFKFGHCTPFKLGGSVILFCNQWLIWIMCIFCFLKELEVNVSRPSLGYDFGWQQVFDESCEYRHFVAKRFVKVATVT